MSRIFPDHQQIRAVILGGSKGIGKAIAEGFAAEGASVAIASREMERFAALKAQLSAKGGTVIYAAVCDVSDPVAVKKFMPAAADAIGGVDVLVNCASSFARANDEKSWHTAFNTDLMGSVRGVNEALPYLKRSSHASIVNLSSVAVRQAVPDRLPYVAMKAALEQYTASTARLYAGTGIRVNCVVVGSTDFPGGIWEQVRRDNPKHYDATKAAIPLGGFASPKQIADAVLFLASPLASWITGQCIVVDGGQSLVHA